jgi:hypothetical protein
VVEGQANCRQLHHRWLGIIHRHFHQGFKNLGIAPSARPLPAKGGRGWPRTARRVRYRPPGGRGARGPGALAAIDRNCTCASDAGVSGTFVRMPVGYLSYRPPGAGIWQSKTAEEYKRAGKLALIVGLLAGVVSSTCFFSGITLLLMTAIFLEVGTQ